MMDGDSTMVTVHNVWREQRNRRRQGALPFAGRNDADEKARGLGGKTICDNDGGGRMSFASLSTTLPTSKPSSSPGRRGDKLEGLSSVMSARHNAL
jgi:hypothetical protein